MRLLVGLRFVVVGPVLRVGLADGFGNADRLRYGGRAVWVLFTLNDIFNGEDVFALDASGFVVGAGAGRAVGVEEDRILSVSRLRGNEPSAVLLADFAASGYFQTFLLSGVHRKTP